MVASSGSGSRDGGGGGGSGPQAVKKGPWTTAEDAILLEYVRRHGEGNWNAVQRNSGLLRCGKSCRLRWANHLRPNLKKGSFSPEEERLIIELHAKLGNKWARMASQLPGRTDNEIKNYWNTRIKRLQRSGLPIYPDDIPQHNQQSRLHQQQNTYPKSKFSPSFSLLQPIDFPTNPIQPSYNSSFLSNPNHQFKLFRDNERSSSNFSLPLAPSIFPLIPNQGYMSDFWPAYSLDQFGSVSTAETELPSIQSPVVVAAVPSSSGTSSAGDYMIGTNNDPPDPTANSGLLEDLVEESKSLVHTQNSKGELFEAGDGEETCVFRAGLRVEGGGGGMYDSSSPYSSVGMKEKDPTEEMNAIDDDLSSLLNNFPLTVPLPNWYDASANTSSNGRSSNMEENGNVRVENCPKESHSPGATTLATTSHKWSLSSRCWNNMPGIC